MNVGRYREAGIGEHYETEGCRFEPCYPRSRSPKTWGFFIRGYLQNPLSVYPVSQRKPGDHRELLISGADIVLPAHFH